MGQDMTPPYKDCPPCPCTAPTIQDGFNYFWFSPPDWDHPNVMVDAFNNNQIKWKYARYTCPSIGNAYYRRRRGGQLGNMTQPPRGSGVIQAQPDATYSGGRLWFKSQ